MALFARNQPYDRNETLARAAKAAGRRQRKKAIAEYRKVLAHEPDNTTVLGKLATLLARTKQFAEARQAFMACAEHYEKQSFDEKALGVYRQAAEFLPGEAEFWERIAKLNVKRGRGPDAVAALLKGRTKFRRKKLRGTAIRLLREAVRIEPWHFAATMDLARLLASEGNKAESRRLYEGLAARTHRRNLRKVRTAMFFRRPTPAAAWHWLRAALGGS